MRPWRCSRQTPMAEQRRRDAGWSLLLVPAVGWAVIAAALQWLGAALVAPAALALTLALGGVASLAVAWRGRERLRHQVRQQSIALAVTLGGGLVMTLALLAFVFHAGVFAFDGAGTDALWLYGHTAQYLADAYRAICRADYRVRARAGRPRAANVRHSSQPLPGAHANRCRARGVAAPARVCADRTARCGLPRPRVAGAVCPLHTGAGPDAACGMGRPRALCRRTRSASGQWGWISCSSCARASSCLPPLRSC